MKLVADTHVHTIASGHAYSTVNELAEEASRKGLELIAITDHTSGIPGGAHDFHFMNLRIIPEKMYGVRILSGAEVNIIDYEGHIDAPRKLLEAVDVVIASLHPPCIDFADKESVTTVIEKIMEDPLIGIIGHPGDSRYPLDAKRIARKAKETGTLLEVNNASLKPTSFRPGVKENLIELLGYCKEYEVPIIIGSDTHFFLDLGEFEESITLLESIDFPKELIMNTDANRLASFISQKRLK